MDLHRSAVCRTGIPAGLSFLLVLILVTGCIHQIPVSKAVETPVAGQEAAAADCVPRRQWFAPASGAAVTFPELIRVLKKQDVVLVGEYHDNADHHLWQLQVIAALHAAGAPVVIGLEMLPRSAQPVLDEWVAGHLSTDEFLRRSQWREYWNFEPQLYLPILQYARINGIALIALNVDRDLVRKVRKQGWDEVLEEEREGVSDPAAPQAGYVDVLAESFAMHGSGHGSAAMAAQGQAEIRNDPDFRRFVESQLLWDRAMAEAIRIRLQQPSPALVVGLMGSGHLMNRHGVPHQLKDFGIERVSVLLPWDYQFNCEFLTADLADYVFGMTERVKGRGPDRPRLGVFIENDPAGGVKITKVVEGSIAQQTGLIAGDVIEIIAGKKARAVVDVSSAVQRTAWGTWLPLRIRRGSEHLELVAKFPPESAAPSDQ